MKHPRYFGLHFDFHAGNTVEIGGNTDPRDIAWYIEQTHPDFVQCDCKGHPGNSCYPTKVGKVADKLVGDNLRVWVDTIHSYGLPVYVHYSGVMDKEYVKAHPEEAAVNEDGCVDPACVSVFGNYVDALMIPQLKELVDEYHIDGVWVDGDNWAVCRDYSANAKPFLPIEYSYAAHNRVMREGFMRYIHRYVDELHRYAPDFSIGSNWLYTSQVPEEPSVDVDYLSGDFDPANSAYRIRFETRCIARQGKPWDLMTWSFGTEYNSYGSISKSAPQMMQEAAMVISHGGGFQMYITQRSDGGAKRSRTDTYRRVADFMHERRFLYGKQPIAQVGILYSAASRYEQTASDPCVYNPPHVSDAIKGVTHAVLDAGYTANVVLEHQLATLLDYEIVIVPEWKHLPEKTEQALITYAENGGHLVVIGADVCARFGELLNFDFGEISRPAQRSLITEKDEVVSLFGDCIDLKIGKGGLYSGGDRFYCDRLPLYRTEPCRQGTVTFLACNLGTCYDFRKSYVVADWLREFLSELAKPWVSVSCRNVDVTLQEDDEGYLLNVINLNQNRQSMEYIVFDEVPALYDVAITLQQPFEQIELPLGEEYTVENTENGTVVRLKKLEIHTIVRLKK